MIERYAYLGRHGRCELRCRCGTDRNRSNTEVPRICLCDTYYDEKKEAVMAAEALGESCSPENVGIFVSGGINEEDVIELGDVVAGFDGNKRCIIEKEREPCAKRGKRGGKK